jgi:uncharacterized membrane protein
MDSSEVLEAWMVLSGPGVRLDDLTGIGFAGVATHEMGHALNLAHTQANGAALGSTLSDPAQPNGCDAPWTHWPDETQSETMYPYITPEPGNTGEFMATVEQLDDTAALSDIYPAPGWPANKGTIRGQILDSSGNPVTGINVIARNIADPFGDCTSYISGQVSKGNAGPDGSFVMNGLTPGASYVLYTDQLMIGAFSVPTPFVLPGPEEYFNGPLESGNGSTDDRCAWTPVAATAGSPVTLDITFNRVAGAPTFIVAPDLSVQTIPFDITADGSVVVGAAGLGGPIFRWEVNANTFDLIGGNQAGQCGISDDGLTIAANVIDRDGTNKAAIYRDGAWTALPPVPGAVPCGYSGEPPTYTDAYGISGDGSTVVGLSYGSLGCGTSTIRAFKWTADGGTVALPKLDAPSRLTRANAVNYDGSVIVGRDDANNGQLRGVQWRNGVYSLIKRNNLPVGEAEGVSSDGQYITGQSNSASTNYNPWLWSPSSGVQLLGALQGQDSALGAAMNDDASVITGQVLDFTAGVITPTIWTSGTGLTDFNEFLSAQGVVTTGLGMRLGMAMSADGRTITGFANAPNGYVGWVLKTPTALVCHTSQQDPSAVETLAVEFPQGLNEHLGHGDTLGSCPCVDADGDGYSTCGGDCNDGDPAIHFGASDANCNGIDENCDGVVDDGASCDDGNPCNGLETCGGANGCLSGTPLDCDDGNPCTDDSCDPQTGCAHVARPDGTACDDGNPATSGDSCHASVCSGSSCPTTPDPKSSGWYESLCHDSHSGDSLTDADARCVGSLTATFAGISTAADICAVLEPSHPNNDKCGKDEDELLVLALNICKQRVCTAQAIDSRCGSDSRSIGESLAQMDAIFSNPNRDRFSCDHGACLGEEINDGRPTTARTPWGGGRMAGTAKRWAGRR